ncbi:MAG: hypothetical protein ACRERE_40585 [Candidatus Entotheonellia bacterium]
MTPLSQWGKTALPVTVQIDPTVDMKTPPLAQVNKMPARQYFSYAAELMQVNPPHITDQPIIARMKRVELEVGQSFDFDNTDGAVQRALEQGAADVLKAMPAKAPTLARVVNGWQMNTDTMGVYGPYYLKRAIIAMVGLGDMNPQLFFSPKEPYHGWILGAGPVFLLPTATDNVLGTGMWVDVWVAGQPPVVVRW